MNAPILNEANVVNHLRAKLKEDFDLADDEKALADTLEGLTDFNEMAVAIVESAMADEGMVGVSSERIKAIKERADRLMQRAERKYDLVRQAMETAGIKKIEAPTVTLSLRSVAPKVIISNEGELPSEYWVETVSRRPNKDAIKDALKVGPVLGASLSNGSTTLAIRTK